MVRNGWNVLKGRLFWRGARLGALALIAGAVLAIAPPAGATPPHPSTCTTQTPMPPEAAALETWLNDGLGETGDAPAAPADETAIIVAQASSASVANPGDEGCLACHGNAGLLMGMVKPAEAPPEDGCAAAPSRPVFLGAFVNPEFPNSVHGRLGCVACHGGDASATEFEAAHAGMKPADVSCATCHADIVERHETSLHKTLNGMAHALRLRSGDENFAKLHPVWQNDCATCHTTCSDCHVTLPMAVGGGLIKGHDFLLRAPMEDSCALCHGSRAGAEYLGQFDGIAPDIHFEKGMHCLDCHTNDLHGDGTLYTNRWQVEGRAQCTDCHSGLPEATVMAHNEAHADVACQVCHAQPYQNCFDCHTGETDGAYFRTAGSKELLLRFGRNTVEGYPFGIVTLRNNPVARDSFDHFGTDLLPDFDAHPTWKTAAPHNIRRITPQNESCANCHEDETLYLGADEIELDDAAANSEVVLPQP